MTLRAHPPVKPPEGLAAEGWEYARWYEVCYKKGGEWMLWAETSNPTEAWDAFEEMQKRHGQKKARIRRLLERKENFWFDISDKPRGFGTADAQNT